MSVLVVGDHPEVTALIEARRANGQDVRDEVWEGVYHMSPFAESGHGEVEMSLGSVLRPYAAKAGLMVTGPFNMGEPDDYRIPDLAVRARGVRGVYLASAEIIGEVLSPGDETFAKFGFYFTHGVSEVLVADPSARTVQILVRGHTSFEEAATSATLGVTGAELAAQVDWPTERG